MTTVTAITTDSQNYCRYDQALNTVTAICTLTGAAAGDTVSVKLVREDGYGTVLTESGTVGTNGQTYIRIALPLESCTDAQYPAIYRARSGSYTVRLTNDSVKSAPFSVSLISIRRMRQEVCLGLPLLTGETVGPAQQPVAVTGVTITQVDPNTPTDVYAITYDHTANTLSWNGGTSATVAQPGLYWLVAPGTRWWMQVRIDPSLLPSATTSENIMITEQSFTDAMLLSEIEKASADVADYLMCYLEPTQVGTQLMQGFLASPPPGRTVSPPATSWLDVIGSPVNYVRQADMNSWYYIQLPQRGVIQVEQLHGFLNTSDVVTLDSTWWTWQERSGLLQLVPNQGAAVAWQFYSGFFYNFLMGSWDTVPNFWHYKVTAGFRDLHDSRRKNIITAVEYKAGINILRQAALHAKPGYTSETLSRGGINASVAYQNGPGGVYAATAEAYQLWLTENLPQIRTRHRGVPLRII